MYDKAAKKNGAPRCLCMEGARGRWLKNAQYWRETGRVQQWWNVEIESCKSH